MFDKLVLPLLSRGLSEIFKKYVFLYIQIITAIKNIIGNFGFELLVFTYLAFYFGLKALPPLKYCGTSRDIQQNPRVPQNPVWKALMWRYARISRPPSARPSHWFTKLPTPTQTLWRHLWPLKLIMHSVINFGSLYWEPIQSPLWPLLRTSARLITARCNFFSMKCIKWILKVWQCIIIYRHNFTDLKDDQYLKRDDRGGTGRIYETGLSRGNFTC